jgi:hypothetical protein
MGKNSAILGLAMLALAACSAQTGIGPSGDKVIPVDLRGGIKIEDDPAIADMNQAAIRWELSAAALAAGCSFPTNGIKFDPNPAAVPVGCVKGDPDKAFHNCKPMGHGDTKFQCVRKPNGYQANACYKYLATLKCTAGDPPPLDPWVRNPR